MFEKTKAVVSGKITLEQAKKIKGMFDSTWNAVCSDWLALFPRKTCKGDAVQEAVADADRYMMYGRDKETGALFKSLDRGMQDEILNLIFPPKQKYSY